MPDYAKTYSTLVVQPVDMVNSFKLDFCFASVIKWLTKWHIDDKKSESLIKAKYYTALCTGTNEPVGPRFALRLLYIQKGLYDPQQGEYEWLYKDKMGVKRRKFYL